MAKKISPNLFLGLGAIGLGLTYLYRTSKEKGVPNINHIEGINVEINPEKLMNNAKKYIKTNPQARDLLANAAKGILGGYLNSNKSEYNVDDDDDEYFDAN